MAKVNSKKVLGELLTDGSQRYTVPTYQRSYTWKEQDVQNLLVDLRDFYEDKIRTDAKGADYYVGPIVVKRDKRELDISPETLLVDGQQRVTTFLILLAAIAKIYPVKGANFDRHQKNLKDYAFTHDEANPKLKLDRGEDEEMELYSILKLKPSTKSKNSDSRQMRRNFNFIVKFLENLPGDLATNLDRLFSAMDDCVYAHIELEPTDDENRMFESINSRGVPLKQADLIKNFLLTKSGEVGNKSVEKDFRQWYEDVLGKVGEKNIDEFFRSLVLVEQPNKSLVIKRTYVAFKDLILSLDGSGRKNPTKDTVATFMEKIQAYADIYDIESRIRKCGSSDPHLLFLWALKPQFNTFFPLFAKLMMVYDGMKQPDSKTYREIVRIVARLILYRSFAPNKTRDITSLVPRIYSKFWDSKRRDGDSLYDFEKWLETSTQEKFRYPTLKEMTDAALTYDAGKGSNRNVRNILWAYEFSTNRGISAKISDSVSNVTIEHFYPQKPGPWNVGKSSDYVSQMKARTNYLGNLFLMPKVPNVDIGNKPFDEKRKIIAKQTSFHMLTELAKYDEWGPAQVDERTVAIAKSVYDFATRPSSKN